MTKQNKFKPSHSYGRILTAHRGNLFGGTIINIIVALIFFGLIAFGVMWVFKSAGDMGHQYVQGMSDTKLKAIDVKCRMNMRAIWQSLQTYVVSNGSFPESQGELVDWCGSTQLFQCPDPNAQKYIYIPGQTSNMPEQNILLYEPQPVHNGRSNVLFLNGQIAALTPDELQAAIVQTMKSFK
jgi:hypothetical protein